MRLIVQVIASVVLSIVATWLLRRLVLSSEQGGDGTPSRSSGVVVVVPVMAGNQWHINDSGRKPGRRPRWGKPGPPPWKK